MKALLARLIVTLGLAGASSAPAAIVWPDLPRTGFIKGRVATIADAQEGNAVFSTDGTGGSALPIEIPQYALWKDEHGAQHPVILVQAEKAPDGTGICGLRDFDGRESVTTLPELTLLGMKKPN